MAIWVADMHFANSPRHVGWRPRDFDPPFNTSSMYGINIINPHGHPDSRFCGFV